MPSLTILSAACVLAGYMLNSSYNPMTNLRTTTAEYEDSVLLSSSFGSLWKSSKSPYTNVQTLSFQIYTGGAPAFTTDATTGKSKHNPECVGCKFICIISDVICACGIEAKF